MVSEDATALLQSGETLRHVPLLHLRHGFVGLKAGVR